MTLEHLDTTRKPPDPPPEDNTPEVPEEGPPQKKDRLWLALAAAALVLAALIGAAVWFSRPAIPDPYAAAREAVDGLGPLPNPVTLGVLGQGELDGGVGFGVSGNLSLQADAGGLALALTDFTIGYEEGSTDIEVNINKDAAAFRLPETSETWYGISFLEGLKVQAAKAVDEELVDWYFTAEQLEEARRTIDDLRVDLGSIHDLDGSEETDWLKRAIADLPAQVEKTENGFELTFDATGHTVLTAADLPHVYAPLGGMTTGAPQISTIILRLDGQKRLVGLEFAFEMDGKQGNCLLDLGDPEEPSPRLELEWGEGNSLELAFTVSEGAAVVMPEFENAFGLLKQLVGE